MDITEDSFEIEVSDEMLKKTNKSDQLTKSKTYKMLEELNKKLGGDEFIELKLKNIPINYEYQDTGKSDRDLWYEAVKDKYEL